MNISSTGEGEITCCCNQGEDVNTSCTREGEITCCCLPCCPLGAGPVHVPVFPPAACNQPNASVSPRVIGRAALEES
jgi:hypothetical protein